MCKKIGKGGMQFERYTMSSKTCKNDGGILTRHLKYDNFVFHGWIGAFMDAV